MCLGRCEKEFNMFGRLFEGLQESIKRRCREHVNFVDYIDFEGFIDSQLGSLNTKFEMGNLDLPDYAFYSGKFETKGLRLGQMLKVKDLGLVSGSLYLKGRGLSNDKLNTNLELNLKDLVFG